jgi:orotate phosphoribosyltransferase
MLEYKKNFIRFALDNEVLKFGEFQLKSGRISPYFFNTGLFDTGFKLGQLGQYFAQALLQSEIPVDVLYGPAYKGIPLVSSTAIAYAQLSKEDIPFVFNRKEAKDHGEGGLLVGASLKGNVIILDDVITAGTSARESIDIICQNGGIPAGMLIALDRQEKGKKDISIIQELKQNFNLPVISIITLADIVEYLRCAPDNKSFVDAINEYQQAYGAS